MDLWTSGLTSFLEPEDQGTPQKVGPVEIGAEVREIKHQVQRLALMCQAMWELLRDRLHLDDADLEALVQEVDLRDGVADGILTQAPLRCPACNRVSSGKHYKCLYCGQLFEKPLFG